MNSPSFLILTPLAYLIGSIPFGLLVGFSKGIDVRVAGSNNIGASNVGRLLGRKYFAVVFFLDMSKSLLPMLIASALVHRISPVTWQIYMLWLGVGFAAVLGHMFSLFLKFAGGKGVASSAGMALGLFPYYTLPALLAMVLFLVVLKRFAMISLGSIVAAWGFPVLYVAIGLALGWPVFGGQWPLLIFATIIAVLITYKHRANITRIRAGTENRVTTPSRSAETMCSTTPPG